MNLPQDWFDAAVAITPGFEVQGDPYLGVSGDFDGMGISCGALQWNIGKKSLQPMVQAVGETVVRSTMPTFGADMWSACGGSIAEGLAIVRSWQNGTTLRPKPKAELRALMGSPAMRQEQNRRIGKVADRALKAANTWAADSSGGTATKRSFCWFFDLTTQNGGLNGLTPAVLKAFMQDHTPDRVDDFICDFLATRPGNSGHAADARKNATLWRGTTQNEKLELLCMSFLRSQSSLPKWRHVVLNRKGAIAVGKGWVNSGLKDFSSYGL
ncbi:peptidoglycan-binding domain 1 protein [Phreatobacter oligotrophus]|jgi:hypothetical protein|uniref:Uncharacterized protein n=1 Tax=Phreatobacter oligotrophus TaxID=1122261 RepID=A0A2T4YYX7_9HYPH|nr:peptidoglycan-binding domain 1 protein [Phreatobacter oligotrophus]PTM51920.1 hypothetical protein C8P69_109208 [Phreatobacter oligotrophus]